MVERNIVEFIIIDKEREFLLQKKTKDYPILPGGHWCLFGGEIEKNETPEKAAERELKEELGISIADTTLINTHKYSFKELQGDNNIFLCHFKGKISDLKLGEGAGFASFSKSEIGDLKISPVSKESLEIFFNLQGSGKI